MPLVAWSPKSQASRALLEPPSSRSRKQALQERDLAKTTLVDAFFTLRIRLSESSCFASPRRARRAGTRSPGAEAGGADRSRTDDIQLAKLALYQLSYSPIHKLECRNVVGLGGFEPPTSRLSGVRSK